MKSIFILNQVKTNKKNFICEHSSVSPTNAACKERTTWTPVPRCHLLSIFLQSIFIKVFLFKHWRWLINRHLFFYSSLTFSLEIMWGVALFISQSGAVVFTQKEEGVLHSWVCCSGPPVWRVWLPCYPRHDTSIPCAHQFMSPFQLFEICLWNDCSSQCGYVFSCYHLLVLYVFCLSKFLNVKANG